MSGIAKLRAAVLTGLLLLPCAALAAAPENLDATTPAKVTPMLNAPLQYELGTEVVVHDWVLCVSQAYAETFARAWASGADQARAAYSDLAAAKSCGRFPEMHVILHEPVYPGANDAGDGAQVFSAAVSLAGRWANAFVVEGGLPVEH